jgi:UDP:flavonoid glycosyltransferase YjiC (YdhE family)
MKALLLSWGSASHYFTLVPLAWALRAAGHDVRVLTPPGAAAAVTASGLPHVSTGPAPDAASVWRGFTFLPGPGSDRAAHEAERARRALDMFVLGAEAMAPGALAFAREWRPDLVIHEPRAYAAIKVAAELGVPSVRVLTGVDYVTAIAEPEQPALRALWDRFGLGGTPATGTLTLDPCPPALQVPADLPRQGFRFVPYAGPCTDAVVPPPERPRVFVTVGTMVGRAAGSMSPLLGLVTALSAMDIELMVGVFADQRGMLDELPPGVRLTQNVPLELILPTCAAIVHQGGGGTTMTSLAAGVPQLLLPSVGDCLLHGEKLDASGAGISRHWLDTGAAEIRALTARLLDEPGYRATAARFAAANAARPAPAALVEMLEKLAGTGEFTPVAEGRTR